MRCNFLLVFLFIILAGSSAAMAQNTEYSIACDPNLSYVKRAQNGQDMRNQVGEQVSCNHVIIVQRPNGTFVMQFQAKDSHSPAYSFTGTRSPQPAPGRQAEYQVTKLYLSTESSRSAQDIPGEVEGQCVIYGLEQSNPKLECVAKADFRGQMTVYRIDARILRH